MSEQTLNWWYGNLSDALDIGEIKAIPGILVAMALDGYGYEAESVRRAMLNAAAVVKVADG